MKELFQTPNAAADGGAGHSKLDVRKLLHVFLERIWLIVAITVTVTALATFYAFKQVPIYQGRAVLEVQQQENKVINLQGEATQEVRTIDVLNTIVQSVKHSSVLRRVISTNKLTEDPAFLSPEQKAGGEVPTEKMVQILGGMVDAKLRPNTRLVDVSVVHRDPKLAQKLANSVGQQFIRESLDLKLGASRLANEVLWDESKKLKAKLETSERALQAYKEQSQTVSLEDKQNIVVQKLRELSQSYTEAKTKRIQVGADVAELEKYRNDPEVLVTLPMLMSDPTIADLRKQVVAQESIVATMTNRYKPKYPKMIQAQQQLADLKTSLRRQAMKFPDSLASDLQTAVAREKNLEVALKEAEQQALELNKKSIDYNVLHRDVESDRAMYESVLKRLKETDITKSLEGTLINFVEPSVLPTAPIKPNRPRLMMLGFLAGLMLGLGLVYFLDEIKSSIKTVDEAEKVLQLPVLGAIPKNAAQKKGDNNPVVLLSAPHSVCAEAFRSLRAAVEMLGRDEQRRILLFTSAVPSEGKSFSCLNFAFCQAQQGKKTLLIDLDLRRPAVARYLNMQMDAPGVSDYLLGKGALKDLVQASADPNVFILTAGPKVPNPAEQLSGPYVAQLLKEAADTYDVVIVDTAPLNAVSDTVYLLKYAQAIFMVIRSGKTPTPGIKRALEQIRRGNAKVAGLVLNYLPQSGGYGYYYYYQHKGGYYSKGVYGATEDSEGRK